MAKIAKQYTIQDFNDILAAGFSYDLKDSNVIELISSLANKVGAPTYIKTPVFPKREKPTGEQIESQETSSLLSSSSSSLSNRRPRNKPSQISDEDWGMIRTFQKTDM